MIRHVRLCHGEPSRVAVARAVNPLSRVKLSGFFGELELSVFVSYPAEELVGVFEVLLNFGG